VEVALPLASAEKPRQLDKTLALFFTQNHWYWPIFNE
jgi:hypothetical protein